MLTGRVDEPVEFVVEFEGLRAGRERRGSALLAGGGQPQVKMRRIVNHADTVQDAQDSEHRSMRGVTNSLQDHLLVVGVQLVVPEAERASPRMRAAAGRTRLELLNRARHRTIERDLLDGENEILGVIRR